MGLQEDNNIILNKFFKKYWFDDFAKGEKSLELIISPKCNLACKYCYIKDYSHITFPEELYDEYLTLKNTQLILDWLTKNKYHPDLEIFSGEILAQKIGYDILELILKHYTKYNTYYPKKIIIPTNFTFLCDDALTEKVEKYIDAFEKINIKLYLSASFDGLYAEENRPLAHSLDIPINIVRDETYYTKLVHFCKKYGYGFHPMIYSKGIEKQKDNFDWLWDLSFNNEVDPFKFLYLLEVRNKNWTEKEVKEFCNFLRHIYFKVWNHYNGDKEKFLNFLLGLDGTPGFNILSTPIIDIGEKISCSIQTTLHVRVADLSIFPCHRTMYRDLKLGEFIYDKHQEDLIFQGQHLELNMVIPTMSSNNMPRCADCEINELCSKGCLGAQYEVTGDLFTPIPTVCNLKFAQIITLIDCLIKTDMYDKVVRAVGNKKAWQIQKLREEMENNLYDESECN